MKRKNIFKIIILIIAVILLILLGVLIYKQFWINKLKKILKENDSINYELVQTSGETTTTVKVYGNIYLSEDNSNIIWISEAENIRVIMDKINKSAIITENSETPIEVGSLNSTYLDYFENDNMNFKYLGTEENFYKIQFTDKSRGYITIFYLNKDTNIIEKITEEFYGAQNTYEISVKLDCVSEDDVKYPDLSEYDIGVSSSTVVEENAKEYEKEVAENAIQENN